MVAQPEEVVADRMTGRVRQAGASMDDTAYMAQVRVACEQDLWVFNRIVLGRRYLTATYHRRLCRFVQHRPPQRKCALEPRGHGKSVIGSQSLPLHIFVQPQASNVYFPGTAGQDTRLLLACETEKRGTDHVRVIENVLEGNALYRALWPHVVWEGNPRKYTKKWNDTEFIIPRSPGIYYPDPTFRCVGVGAATAGSHPAGMIKDDIVGEAASNSQIVMEATTQWHKASRALINDPTCLEWIFGTRWNLGDTYEVEVLNDPTVECSIVGILDGEGGTPVWPEKVALTDADRDAWNATHPDTEWKHSVEQYKRESGSYFPLFYLNQPCDPTLTDFQPEQLRTYTIEGERVCFPVDARDARMLAPRSGESAPSEASRPGSTAPGRGARDDAADAYDPRSGRRGSVRMPLRRGW